MTVHTLNQAEYTNTNVTHIILDVYINLGLQQHSNNSAVTILSSYHQHGDSILGWAGKHIYTILAHRPTHYHMTIYTNVTNRIYSILAACVASIQTRLYI